MNAARTVESLPSIAHLEAEQVVGPAWTAVVTGDTRRGRELLLAAADRAAVSGCRAPEAWLRHEVARLGDAPSVVDRLEELAAVCEGALIQAYGFHARAAVRQDPEQLEEASRRFEATGALLLAAEAATSAGLAYQRARTQKAATANFARAAALAAGCEGARTPALVTTTGVVPLTTREREIGLLAAEGATSRDIAGRLYLSVRTVENHLQRTYTKLGVGTRAELAAALRAGEPGAPPSLGGEVVRQAPRFGRRRRPRRAEGLGQCTEQRRPGSGVVGRPYPPLAVPRAECGDPGHERPVVPHGEADGLELGGERPPLAGRVVPEQPAQPGRPGQQPVVEAGGHLGETGTDRPHGGLDQCDLLGGHELLLTWVMIGPAPPRVVSRAILIRAVAR